MTEPALSGLNYTTKETTPLTRFISGFNFAYPEFNNLPDGFPHCELNGLTKSERYLYEAIIIAWLTCDARGIKQLHKNVLKTAVLTLSAFLLIIFSDRLSRSTGFTYVKEISAATVSATLKSAVAPIADERLDSAIDSTVSAMLK